MPYTPKVAVLLACYNGELYIEEQVKSIQAQTYQNWLLFVRDDLSTDRSLSLLKGMAETDSRIVLMNNNLNLGVVGNFEALMRRALEVNTLDYVFFSDQDDIWNSCKIELMISCFKEVELEQGLPVPILVHSDLSVVDNKMQEIHPSFMRYESISHESKEAWRVLAVQNFVTGCAMAANRQLLELSLPLPKSIVMHDWWLALCASVFGRISYIETPLTAYRQHGANIVGANGFFSRLNPFQRRGVERFCKGKKDILLAIGQMESIVDRMGGGEQELVKKTIADELRVLSSIEGNGRLKRLAIMYKHKIRRQSIIMTILLYGRVFAL